MRVGRIVGLLLAGGAAAGWIACLGDSGTPTPVDAGSDSGGVLDVAVDTAVPDAATWDPSALGSRLTVWLDSTRGVTVSAGKVAAWKDQSGNNNDALQASSTNAPTVDVGVAGGKDAIHFNEPDSGADPIYLAIADDATTMRWGLGDFTLAVVTKFNRAGGYAALWNKASGVTCPCPGVALFTNAQGSDGGPLLQVQSAAPDAGATIVMGPTSVDDGKFHILVGRRSGQSTLELRVDGASTIATVIPVDVSGVGATAGIGAGATGFGPVGKSQLLYGDIAEIIAARGVVGDDEVKKVEAYLKAKYAL